MGYHYKPLGMQLLIFEYSCRTILQFLWFLVLYSWHCKLVHCQSIQHLTWVMWLSNE